MELSIIVLAYRMQREAPRTLRSLLRPLQKAVGDELFKISVWAGACGFGKYNRLNESNAFSMSKKLYWQMGGYNEGFASPGGGLSNLELFSRCVERPNAVNILLAGEATFHQFHGGAATSDVDFFDNAQAEHLAATGKPYRLPIYPYFVDFGEDFARPAAVGGYFGL